MGGFGDWVEIFAGGMQVDSSGRDWDGDELVDKAVATFDPSFHEPPNVIGHPKENAPAWGWVSGVASAIKGGKKVLLARFKDVPQEFTDMVRANRFKKRSASFYPDGRLRHVGWLGAMPPAVKGLANMEFSGFGAAATFEFGLERPEKISKNKGGKVNFKERLKNFFNKAVDELPEEDIPQGAIAMPGARGGEPGKSGHFSEADVEAARLQAAREAREQAVAEFAEKERQAVREAEKRENRSWVEGLVEDGKMPPSMANSGVLEFMDSLDGESMIEFSEGGKKTGRRWFMDFMERLAVAPLFAEIATHGRAGNAADFAEAKADAEEGRKIAAKVNRKPAK